MTKHLNRIYHPWWKWECYKNGFYREVPQREKEASLLRYRDFLADIELFNSATKKVFDQWPISCEQFLTNTSINRIAWIGQASACVETGLPSTCRAGFKLLSPVDQKKADELAEHNLKRWIAWKLRENELKNIAALGWAEAIRSTYQTRSRKNLRPRT